jgi:hypothetical protein
LDRGPWVKGSLQSDLLTDDERATAHEVQAQVWELRTVRTLLEQVP